MSAKSLSAQPACVSLVVPVRDESATICGLLSSIARQTRQPDEMIFVDGGSRDNTVELLSEAAKQDARIKVIPAREASPGRGRNIGISHATHDWIALTDAGIRLEAEWLERLLGAFEKYPEAKIVYGNFEPVTDTLFERCAALAYVPKKQSRDGGLMRGPSTASMLVHREVWKETGGFPDRRAAEDLTFIEEVQKKKFPVAWAPTATVWWHLRPNLSATFRKFTLYSKHNVWIGRQWDWHYGIARQYAVGLACLCLAAVLQFWWLALLPALGFLARIAKTIWSKKEDKGLLKVFSPLPFLLVGVILLTIDAATFSGWIQAYVQPEARDAEGAVSREKIS